METTVKTAIQISKSALTEMVNNGSKKDEIAKHFGLNINQTTKALKQAGLSIRRFNHLVFTLVD